MGQKRKIRESNLELLRILCILMIIGDHFVGQSGIIEWGSLGKNFFYCAVTSLSRVACSVFIIISAWFSIDRKFDIRKIIHVWLTVIMYTVPIILYCLSIGIASKRDVFMCMQPISGSPLWFAGYYIILMLFSPALNYLICEAPKVIHMWIIAVLFVLMVLYSTVTAELGFFGHDIWVLFFLYLTTGYIKKYKTIPKGKTCFFVFGVVWSILTFARAYVVYINSELYFISIIGEYCEFYRARLQTIPNLLMAYSLFFGFYRLKVCPSRVINFFAGKSLGVYCFHQVPTWYPYLWATFFQASKHIEMLHGYKRMLYVVVAVFAVWSVGCVLESIRNFLSKKIIEERKFYNNICETINIIINENKETPIFEKKNVKILFVVVIVMVLLKCLTVEIF